MFATLLFFISNVLIWGNNRIRNNVVGTVLFVHKKRSAGKRFETRRGAGENTFSYKVFSPAPIPLTFLLKALFPLRVGKKTIFPRKFLQTAFNF